VPILFQDTFHSEVTTVRYQTYVHERNWGARIREFEFRGYAMVALENRFLRIVLAAGKGTDILEFLYKPLDVDFMWRSYTGLRDGRAFDPTIASPSGAFIDHYAGGWQEMLPNAGNECKYKGAAEGVHGEVCLLPWRYVITKDTPDEVSVCFTVRTLRTPFFVEKTLTLQAEEPVLRIDEMVRNEADEPMDFMWGHHPAFGWPFVDESCRIFLPPCRVLTADEYTAPTSRLERSQKADWPLVKGRKGETIDLSQVPPPEIRAHDLAFMHDLQDGWYAVVNPSQGVGFGLRWDEATFPFLWFWQVYRGGMGYPWFGATYNIALEPASSYPQTLTEAIKAGTQLVLPAGGERRTQMLALAFSDRSEVGGIGADGKVF
jgi:galactose mutarotase-like enzyme